jgi:hypothetical protein
LLHGCADELGEGPYIQTPEEMLRSSERFEQGNRILDELLQRLSQSG